MPGILSSVQSLIWPIMGGAILLAGGVMAFAFLTGGERAKAAPKKVKEVKVKEKVKKEKVEKVAQEKPAKEKKSFFGKKKK